MASGLHGYAISENRGWRVSNEREERAVVDRIEDGGQAVLLVGEEEREHVVSGDRLPPGAKAGIWLRVRFSGGDLVCALIDAEETERAQQRVREKMERLRRRGRRL